jgi:hypothetical protein
LLSAPTLVVSMRQPIHKKATDILCDVSRTAQLSHPLSAPRSLPKDDIDCGRPAISAAFLSSLVEAVEALTIVLAVGTVRGWRPAGLAPESGPLSAR